MSVVRPLESVPWTRPRRLLRSPIRVPANSSGASISTFMMGSSRQGLRVHGLAEGEAAGRLEGHFVGVDVVIAAVVDGGLEVDDGVAGEIAAGGGLDDALLDGGDEVAGDGAAEDFVGELEAAAAGQGSMRILQSPNWPWPPDLLFVAALGLGLGADGFAVRNLGRFEGDFGVVALFEAADDGLDVRLAGAGDEEFVGLRIAEEADEQVFFHELVDGGGELVFVGAGFGLDGVGHGRLGERVEVDLTRRPFGRGCRR